MMCIDSLFFQDRHSEIMNYPFNILGNGNNQFVGFVYVYPNTCKQGGGALPIVPAVGMVGFKDPQFVWFHALVPPF